jgi:ribosome-interacting GTPase 1
LEEELEAVGIRLNKSKPKIYFKPRKSGGLHVNSMVPLTKLDDKLIHSILNEYSKQRQ